MPEIVYKGAAGLFSPAGLPCGFPQGLEPVHFGHLPVWSRGNVYRSGAKACRHERHGLVLDDAVKLELVEKGEGWYLDTDLYDHMKDLNVPMIHTGMLGEAFEPRQKFENPDGTPIVFDTDYFG